MNEVFISSSRDLQIRKLSNINSPPHIHSEEEIEMTLVISGESNCVINGTSYKIKSGDLVIITRYQTHSYYHTAEIDTFSFIFQKSLSEKLYDFFNNHTFLPPVINIINDFNQLQPIFDALEFELSAETSDNLIYKSFAQIVVKKIIDIIDKGSSTNREITMTSKSDFLKTAQLYCIENYEKNISVYDIAKHVGVHPNYLSSAFKKHFGITIIQYLNICRLKHATSLINNKSLPMTEISFASGFQSIRTFNRIFKKEMGCTPKEYQKII